MSDVTVSAMSASNAETVNVRVAGALVYDTAAEARPRLRALVDGGFRRLIVDASDLDFLDSSGLGVLLAAWQRMDRDGRRLEVRGVHGQPARVLALTGSDVLLIADRGDPPTRRASAG
jgi:anti-sigma B factor antagonist